MLDCGGKVQNDAHIDTYYCKPELISWRWINITVFNMRFLSPTNQNGVDSSMYWQFFFYSPPEISIYSGRDHKNMMPRALNIYIYIDITLTIIDMYFLYL